MGWGNIISSVKRVAIAAKLVPSTYPGDSVTPLFLGSYPRNYTLLASGIWAGSCLSSSW